MKQIFSVVFRISFLTVLIYPYLRFYMTFFRDFRADIVAMLAVQMGMHLNENSLDIFFNMKNISN